MMDALPDCFPDPGVARLVQETRSGGPLDRRRSSFGALSGSFEARSGLVGTRAKLGRGSLEKRPGPLGLARVETLKAVLNRVSGHKCKIHTIRG